MRALTLLGLADGYFGGPETVVEALEVPACLGPELGEVGLQVGNPRLCEGNPGQDER